MIDRTFKASNVKGDRCVEFKFNLRNIFMPNQRETLTVEDEKSKG